MPSQNTVRSERLLGAALFLSLVLIYLASPVRHLSDSRYTLLTTEAILTHGDLDLARFGLLEGSGTSIRPQLIEVGTQWITFHPPGPAILAIPLVLIARLARFSVVDEAGHYDETAELLLQGIAAAVVAAGTGLILFAIARRDLSARRALVVALASSLGTSIWSSASRVLWSQTIAVAFLAAALLERRRWDGDRPERPRLLALLLVGATLARPSAALFAVLFTVDVALTRRRLMGPLVRVGIVALIVAPSFHWLLSGSPAPAYLLGHAERGFRLFGLGEALAGHLVSPSRGLLIFSPVALVALWSTWRWRARGLDTAFVRLCLAAVVAHWLVVSFSCVWWGGGSYGPRLMLETVPFLAALAVTGWRRALEAPRASGTAQTGALVALSIAASVAAHAAGALSPAALQWNAKPVPLSHRPSRVWDWSDPQFLAWRSRQALPHDAWPPRENPCPPLRGD